eukprot:10382808-Lingulodinium_polyedra.AAC.1
MLTRIRGISNVDAGAFSRLHAPSLSHSQARLLTCPVRPSLRALVLSGGACPRAACRLASVLTLRHDLTRARVGHVLA